MSLIVRPDDLVVEFLRSKLTDVRSRHVTESESFVATAGQTVFVVTPSESRLLRCVNSVIVDGVSLKKWRDYSIDLARKKVILVVGAGVGDEVVISFKGSASGDEWIFPDMPVSSLGASKFPRLSVMIVDVSSVRGGGHASDLIDRVHFQVDVWVKDNFVFTLDEHKFSKQELADYLGFMVKKAFAEGEDDLYPRLYDYEGMVFGSFPFDDVTQTYRHKQEFLLSGENLGEY